MVLQVRALLVGHEDLRTDQGNPAARFRKLQLNARRLLDILDLNGRRLIIRIKLIVAKIVGLVVYLLLAELRPAWLNDNSLPIRRPTFKFLLLFFILLYR